MAQDFDLTMPTERAEKYLAKMAKAYDGTLPEPISNIDKYLKIIAENDTGGGSGSGDATTYTLSRETIYDDFVTLTDKTGKKSTANINPIVTPTSPPANGVLAVKIFNSGLLYSVVNGNPDQGQPEKLRCIRDIEVDENHTFGSSVRFNMLGFRKGFEMCDTGEFRVFETEDLSGTYRKFKFPKKGGTLVVADDIPDISGKQDKLTAGTNITIDGNTINAKDTTYSDVTQSAHGLMSAADKKKLDDMDLTKYLAKDGTAKKADGLSTGQLKFGYIHNSTSTATAGKTWTRVAYCVVPKGYTTITMAMLVTSGNSGVALFDIDFRSNANNDGFDYFNVKQIITNFPERVSINDMKAFAKSTSDGMQYEIWYNIKSIYGTRQFTCLAEQRYGGANSNEWKFETHTAADFEASPPTDGTEATYSSCGVVSTAETLTDSGWIVPDPVCKYKTSSIKYRKYGQCVTMTGGIQLSQAYTDAKIFQLPEDCRPPTEIITIGSTYTSPYDYFPAKISVDGYVTFLGKTENFFNTSNSYVIHDTFFVK